VIRFRFVQDNMTELPVKRMCELAEIPRSSFYAWLTRTPSARDVADAALLEVIRDIYARSRNTYGVPRMVGQLHRRGHRVSRGRVARLMRANNLIGAHASKKWRRGRPDAGGVPDLLQRNFRADSPNQRWVADITEFVTGDGKLYLAAVRDLHHRGIVGWDTAGRQDAALVVSALTMALARTGHPANVIHHADKGTQGELNRSSQHLMTMEVCGGATAAVGRQGSSPGDAVAGAAGPSPSCGARVLASDRSGQEHRGRCSRDRGVGPCRVALVPSRWRDATCEPRRTDRPVSVIR
jgi:putative transposase